jgi:hypothetical protein
VRYEIQTAPAVDEYLARLAGKEISREAIEGLVEEYSRELSERADFYLQSNPVAHESYCFHFDSVLVDGNRLYEFNFVVDTSTAPFGVILVAFVEHHLISERGT